MIERAGKRRHFFFGKTGEHPRRKVVIRMAAFADADFHSGEGVRSGTVYDAFDTVMPAVAALAPNAKPPGVQ